jgi:signal transduction histidine kinase
MAEARRAHATARQQEIANHEQGVQTYFSVRDHNRQMRKAEHGPRVTDEQIRRMAAAGTPAPLSPSDVDWINGRIIWPTVLEDNDFGAFRAELERAFASRAALGRMDGLTMAKAQQAARGMLDELKTQVRELSSQDYMVARRFVESLAHEIRQPAG